MKEIIYETGSKGFVGSHLLEALGKERVTTIPHEDLASIKLQPFKEFYFLSSYGNMSFHTEDKKILQANVSDLIHVLQEIDFKTGFKSFVFFSTSSVRLRVQTMYSRTKKAAEEILLSYMEKYNVPICVVRPFSVTGRGEQKEHLIPTLIRSCLDGELVNFVSQPKHDFIDVEDVVDGVLSLSSHSARGIYELGTGKEYTNFEVLKIVEKVTGKEANINPVNSLRLYDTDSWVSMNYKARGYGWTPRISLEQSITNMVEEYKNANRDL